MRPIRVLRQAVAAAPLLLARRRASRRALAARLGPLRGASTKVAQLLAALDGEDAGRALDPVPLRALLPAVRAAAGDLLGEPPDIEPEGRRASLGQVHRARLTDGRPAALKVLLPGVEADLRADLALAGWLGRRAGRRAAARIGGVEVDDWIGTLGDELLGELDYRAEGEAQRAYRDAVVGVEGVVVPELVRATDGMLVSTWEEAAPLSEAMGWEGPLRARLGETLAAGVLRALLGPGLAHGDLHPGNVGFRRTGEVVLYDFGATRRLAADAVVAWRALVRGTGDPWDALLALGFDPDRLEPIRPGLAELAALLFGPFRGPLPTRVRAEPRRARAAELLGEHRMAPRLAAPPDLTPAVRTLSGLLSILGHLDVPMCLGRALEGVPGAVPAAPRPAQAQDAARLLVRSHGADGRGVEVRLPFRALSALEDLLPDSARDPIRRAGVDLAALARAALARGPVDQVLYDGVVDGRRVELLVVTAPGSR